MPNTKKCKECGRTVLRISWSGLRTHEECKMRGKLMRTGKKMNLENQRVFFPGTVTDRVVRDWLSDDPHNNPGVMPDMVEAIVNRERQNIADEGAQVVWKGKGDREQIIKDCIEAVTKIEPGLNKYVLPFEWEVDKRFELPLKLPNYMTGEKEEILLIGAMDIRVRDANGQYAVWDVKHTRDDSYFRKVTGQLSFYDVATYLEFGKGTQITGLLQPLCKQPVRRITLDPDSRTQLLTRIVAMANDIWADKLPVRKDMSMCTSFCPTKHACPKFIPVEVGGKRTLSIFKK